MNRFSLFIIFHLLSGYCIAQLQPSSEVDIKNYSFRLELNDSTDQIKGIADIELSSKKEITAFELDLIGSKSDGKGMIVDEIKSEKGKLDFKHVDDRIKITLPSALTANTPYRLSIQYHGIPADGLIISKNKFGDRTFFADNWPNRGRNWIPVVDHPADKATVDWTVVAPVHYEVVANGIRVEESYLNAKQKLTRYREAAPIATKVMVIGVARFAVKTTGVVDGIPIEIWVYPQNREIGFDDFKYATRIFEYFHRTIGPYSYGKLANVQSKTTFGGLENASAIFYFENAVDGKGSRESLIAHEIAHQWFGDSAGEKEWKDVWLSEGFATYFCILWLERAYGDKRRQEEMLNDRNQIISFHKKTQVPVVQPVTSDILQILNTNSYQKGSFVLHMLRREIGDQAFWEGIREYYRVFKDGNATTADLQKIMEGASKKDLKVFFRQWIETAGHPVLDVKWSFVANGSKVSVTVNQVQKNTVFEFPLEIVFFNEKNEVLGKEKVSINKGSQEFSIPATAKPARIELDPGINLLFESNLRN